MEVITWAAQNSDRGDAALVGALAVSAVVILTYRIYRLSKGGPVADVYGGAVLALLVAGIALLESGGVGWARWAALAYGLLFALVVMPVWTLAVLLPLRPGPVDHVATAVYWGSLVAIVIAALS